MFGGNSPLVIDPKASEVEQILDELIAVMRKYGYVLRHDPTAMFLGKISDGVGFQCVIVAQIQEIAPTHSTWRPVRESKSVKLIQ